MQKELKLLNPKKTKNPTKDGQKWDIYLTPFFQGSESIGKEGHKDFRVSGQGGLLQNFSSGHIRAIAFMNIQLSCLSKTYTDEPNQYFSTGGGGPALS